ncbi:hypothetical protein G7046_g146 [Stylonectria norvegica]|nr:hypothetical protein G7046_g146 [Stylonectria norvegica]
MARHNRAAPFWTFLALTIPLSSSVSDSSSKRGLAFQGDDHQSDASLLVSKNSTIAWYYTWSLWPAQFIGDTIQFLPLVHSLSDASDAELVSRLDNLPASATHILSFNEPDGETDTGGSSISPEDAAHSYLSNLVPLRESTKSRTRNWNISHPSVTGSDNGIDWLRRFNASCFEINDTGCPTDFVAVHWYGDYAGLVSWLETLRGFYNETNPDIRYWITEIALPKAGKDATLTMMNESLAYLDKQNYIEGYAWFGAFRANEANEWTGDSVSMFDKDGSLTELGAFYVGGEERGFKEGMSGSSGPTTFVPLRNMLWAVAATTVLLIL